VIISFALLFYLNAIDILQLRSTEFLSTSSFLLQNARRPDGRSIAWRKNMATEKYRLRAIVKKHNETK
jgi:hypothetical protein